MPRYVKQTDQISCGPIAILNACLWGGRDVTKYEHLSYLRFACHTVDQEHPDEIEQNGTTDWNFDRVLRYVGKGCFIVHRRKSPTASKIRKFLVQEDTAIALSYHWYNEKDKEKGDHYCFIAGMEGAKFITVNDHFLVETATNRVAFKDLQRMVNLDKQNCFAWFLKKGVTYTGEGVDHLHNGRQRN